MSNIIHRPSHNRVTDGGATGPGLLALFAAMAEESEEFGNEAHQMVVTYIDSDDDFKVGTYVPELWLVVRKVLPDGTEAEDQGREQEVHGELPSGDGDGDVRLTLEALPEVATDTSVGSGDPGTDVSGEVAGETDQTTGSRSGETE